MMGPVFDGRVAKVNTQSPHLERLSWGPSSPTIAMAVRPQFPNLLVSFRPFTVKSHYKSQRAVVLWGIYYPRNFPNIYEFSQ